MVNQYARVTMPARKQSATAPRMARHHLMRRAARDGATRAVAGSLARSGEPSRTRARGRAAGAGEFGPSASCPPALCSSASVENAVCASVWQRRHSSSLICRLSSTMRARSSDTNSGITGKKFVQALKRFGPGSRSAAPRRSLKCWWSTGAFRPKGDALGRATTESAGARRNRCPASRRRRSTPGSSRRRRPDWCRRRAGVAPAFPRTAGLPDLGFAPQPTSRRLARVAAKRPLALASDSSTVCVVC